MPAPSGLEGLAGVISGRGWRQKKRLFKGPSTWWVEAVRIPLGGRGRSANGRGMKFVFLSRIRRIDLVSRPSPLLRLYRS